MQNFSVNFGEINSALFQTRINWNFHFILQSQTSHISEFINRESYFCDSPFTFIWLLGFLWNRTNPHKNFLQIKKYQTPYLFLKTSLLKFLESLQVLFQSSPLKTKILEPFVPLNTEIKRMRKNKSEKNSRKNYNFIFTLLDPLLSAANQFWFKFISSVS